MQFSGSAATERVVAAAKESRTIQVLACIIAVSISVAWSRNAQSQADYSAFCEYVRGDGFCGATPNVYNPVIFVSPTNPVVSPDESTQGSQPPLKYSSASELAESPASRSWSRATPPSPLPQGLEGVWGDQPPPSWSALPLSAVEVDRAARQAVTNVPAIDSYRAEASQVGVAGSPAPALAAPNDRYSVAHQQHPSAPGVVPTLPETLGGPKQEHEGTGDPVNPATGEFSLSEVDLELSGVGPAFRLERYYSSHSSRHGVLGFGWSHSYEQRLVFTGNSCGDLYYDWETGRGFTLRFVQDRANGRWFSESTTEYYLTVGDAYTTVHSRSGLRHVFRRDGSLHSLLNLNGKGLAFQWQAGILPDNIQGLRLEQVIDSVGRVIRFSYDPRGYLVDVEVAGLPGAALYQTDENGDLIRATRPGGVFETYEYDTDPTRDSAPTLVPDRQLLAACETACGARSSRCQGPCDQAEAASFYDRCKFDAYNPSQCLEQATRACTSACTAGVPARARQQCSEACQTGCFTQTPEERAAYCEPLRGFQGDALQECVATTGKPSCRNFLSHPYVIHSPHEAELCCPDASYQMGAFEACLAESLNCEPRAGAIEAANTCEAQASTACGAVAAAQSCLETNECPTDCAALCDAGLMCAHYTTDYNLSVFRFTVCPDIITCGLFTLGEIALNIARGGLWQTYWDGRLCSNPWRIHCAVDESPICTNRPAPPRCDSSSIDLQDGWECNHQPCMMACNACSSACRRKVGELCEESVDCAAACGGPSVWTGADPSIEPGACRRALAQPCQDECLGSWDSVCKNPAISAAACDRVDFFEPCASSCVASCTETHRDPAGERFGNISGLNHNLIRIFDGEGRPYLENIYESDPYRFAFDRVVEQTFGGEQYSFGYYDLRNAPEDLMAQANTLGHTGLVETRPAASVLCQNACEEYGQETVGARSERWIEVSAGDYLVFADPFGGDVDIWPTVIGKDGGMDAVSWIELTHIGGQELLVDPAVPLPPDGVEIHSPWGIALVTPTMGNAALISGLPAGAIEAILERGTLSLIRTSRGNWRALNGRAALGTRAIPAGACGVELEFMAQGGGLLAPGGACEGVVTITELGRRDGEESAAALLSSPYRSVAWSFEGGPRVIENQWHQPDWLPQAPDCEPSLALAVPDVACETAIETWPADSAMLPPDCSQPWSQRAEGLGSGLFLGCTGIPPHVPADLPPDSACRPEAPEFLSAVELPHGHPAQPLVQATVVRGPDGRGRTFYAGPNHLVLRTVVHGTGAAHDWNYARDGRLLGERDAMGRRTCLRYDGEGNATRTRVLPAPDRYAPSTSIDHRAIFGPWGRPAVILEPNGSAPVALLDWDASGNLLSVTRPEEGGGASIQSFVMDPSSAQVTSTTHPSGRTDRFDYDQTTGTLRQLTLAEGAPEQTIRTIESDGFGRLVRIEQPGHPVIELGHAPDGRLLWERVALDPSKPPAETLYFYDGAGLLEHIEGPRASTFFTRNGQAEIVSVRDEAVGPQGQLETRVRCFDVIDGRVRNAIDPEGRWTILARDGNGDVFRVERGVRAATGPWATPCNGNLTDGSPVAIERFVDVERRPEAGGQIERIHYGTQAPDHPLQSRRIVVDGFGRLIEESLAETTTRYGHDAFGRIVWTAVFEGAPPPYSADGPALSEPTLRAMTKHVFAPFGGHLSEVHRAWFDDSSGARVMRGTHGWVVTRFERDEPARRIRIIDDRGTTVVTFDHLGREMRRQLPDGQTVITTTYNPSGLSVETRITPAPTPGNSLVKRAEYTSFGSLTLLEDEAGKTEYSASFDALGQLSAEHRRGENRAFVWDAFGQLVAVSRVGPSGPEHHETRRYNRNGLVVSLVDGAQNQITWQYDHANRAIAEHYSDQTSRLYGYFPGSGDLRVSFTRDGDHSTYEYDGAGRLTRQSGLKQSGGVAVQTDVLALHGPLGPTELRRYNVIGGVLSENVDYKYKRNSLGGVVFAGSSLFSGEDLQIDRDASGFPLRYSAAADNVSLAWDVLGRLDQAHLGSTMIADWSYAGAGPATSVALGAHIIETRTYDSRLRLSSKGLAAQGGPVVSHRLTYSEDDRLARVDRSLGSGAAVSDVFAPDMFGRIESAARSVSGLPPAIATAQRADIDSWLSTSVNPEIFDYDLGDNAIFVERDGVATQPLVGPHHAVSDWAGPVESNAEGATLQLPDGTAFVFDGLGQIRTAQRGSQTWTFLYDPFGQLVGWDGPDGPVRIQYADGRIFRVRAGATEVYVPGDGLDPAAVSRGGALLYRFTGHGERLAALVEPGGAVAESYSYGAYGDPQVFSSAGAPLQSSSAGNRLLLTGQPYFPELGLHRQGVRWYRPEWGRFITPDPLGFLDGPNPFVYVGAQPMEFIDPLGLCRKAAGGCGSYSSPANGGGSSLALVAPIGLTGLSVGTGGVTLPTALGVGPFVLAIGSVLGPGGLLKANGRMTFTIHMSRRTGPDLESNGPKYANDPVTYERLRQQYPNAAVYYAGSAEEAEGHNILLWASEADIPARGVNWTSHGGKHIAKSGVPWRQIVQSTEFGPAKYRPGTAIEALERKVWTEGTAATNGRPWKVMEFADEIGASGGSSSYWVRVEESGGTIHGHPITRAEFRKLTR